MNKMTATKAIAIPLAILLAAVAVSPSVSACWNKSAGVVEGINSLTCGTTDLTNDKTYVKDNGDGTRTLTIPLYAGLVIVYVSKCLPCIGTVKIPLIASAKVTYTIDINGQVCSKTVSCNTDYKVVLKDNTKYTIKITAKLTWTVLLCISGTVCYGTGTFILDKKADPVPPVSNCPPSWSVTDAGNGKIKLDLDESWYYAYKSVYEIYIYVYDSCGKVVGYAYGGFDAMDGSCYKVGNGEYKVVIVAYHNVGCEGAQNYSETFTVKVKSGC